jgi:hypothetical protein
VDEIVAASVLVDVGEKDLPGAGDLGLSRNRRCIASSRPTLAVRLRRQASRSDLKPLRDDIRRDLVFDEGDTVAQLQLAFLQPLQPQQIRRRRLMQRVDRCVEIAVLLLQPGEFVFELALIFVGHGVR